MQNFGHETQRYWRCCLSRRSQKGLLNWEKMNVVLKKHPLVRPKIRISYPDLKSYVRL
jgi:hypothetical protein